MDQGVVELLEGDDVSSLDKFLLCTSEIVKEIYDEPEYKERLQKNFIKQTDNIYLDLPYDSRRKMRLFSASSEVHTIIENLHLSMRFISCVSSRPKDVSRPSYMRYHYYNVFQHIFILKEKLKNVFEVIYAFEKFNEKGERLKGVVYGSNSMKAFYKSKKMLNEVFDPVCEKRHAYVHRVFNEEHDDIARVMQYELIGKFKSDYKEEAHGYFKYVTKPTIVKEIKALVKSCEIYSESIFEYFLKEYVVSGKLSLPNYQ